jgi:hypothetical protein
MAALNEKERSEKEGGAGQAVAAVKVAITDPAKLKKEEEAIAKWNADMKAQEAIMYSLPNKSKYKTFILSDAVFEVEQRYEIKEIVGHGAYGIVWYARSLFAPALPCPALPCPALHVCVCVCVCVCLCVCVCARRCE